MSTELYIFTMLTQFAGYESVHFGLHYTAKNGPTGAAWGLMHTRYRVESGSVGLAGWIASRNSGRREF